MPGFFVFNPDNPEIGFSTGDSLAVNVFLDILTDTLYLTDASEIVAWEGGTDPKVYIWRSQKIRFPKLTNIGAALVEAESYVDITFRLYADGALKHTQVVVDDEPFRLPGGYLSNIYEVELEGVDIINGVTIGDTVFDLAAG